MCAVSEPEIVHHDEWKGSPLVWAAGCWVGGLILGHQLDGRGGSAWLITAAAAMLLLAFVLMRRHLRGAWAPAAMSLVCTAAAWWTISTTMEAGLKVDGASRLACIEGVVEGEVYRRTEAAGLLGGFDYRGPSTKFVVRVDRMDDGIALHAVRAAVLVDSPSYDGRVHTGDRVRCTGWLAPLRTPSNPGERDSAAMLHDQGIVARLALKTRGNCQIVCASASWLTLMREQLMRGAGRSLDAGIEASTPQRRATLAMLHTMLLGDRRNELGELDQAFRNTGLAHLLAISGLHLAILVAGVWGLLAFVTWRPHVAAIGALAVIGLYVVAVPPKVPLLRAAVMTAIACWALTRGRRVSAVSTMALAGLGLLMWRPGDLFSAGFELSFAVVAGLIVLTPGVGRWLRAPGLQEKLGDRGWMLRKYGTDYAAVTIVAWCMSLPLVAYHFGVIVPMGLVMSVLMLPAAGVLLWAGYLKMALSAVWPVAGAAAGPIVMKIAMWIGAMVQWGAEAPGGVMRVPGPTVLWAIAAMGVMIAMLSGMFAGRRWALAASVMICAVWLVGPGAMSTLRANDAQASLKVNMFAVGDGSCYLLRSGSENWMFDCGSSNYYDITTVTIGPALRALGVHHVDTLFISHPDTDHFSGALELVEQFGVRRVVTTQTFIDSGEHHVYAAAAAAMNWLKAHHVPIESAAAGWREPFGEAEVQLMWPPAGMTFERDNDSSLVLSVRAAGRRVLFCGDVQQVAMAMMIKRNVDVKADVLELPHHGSMTPESPAWFERVSPSVVLQSSGPTRVRYDRWGPYLKGIERHITCEHGAVELTIASDGSMHAERFRQTPVEPAAAADVE
ncbi:MAG: DUF4131 domain-containing protein [Planctomycetes bacterium]|nr:DUF4131 domain-containing protein [Planctomycetota bacterium]